MKTQTVYFLVGGTVIVLIGYWIAKSAVNAFTGGGNAPPVKSIDDLVKTLSNDVSLNSSQYISDSNAQYLD